MNGIGGDESPAGGATETEQPNNEKMVDDAKTQTTPSDDNETASPITSNDDNKSPIQPDSPEKSNDIDEVGDGPVADLPVDEADASPKQGELNVENDTDNDQTNNEDSVNEPTPVSVESKVGEISSGDVENTSSGGKEEAVMGVEDDANVSAGSSPIEEMTEEKQPTAEEKVVNGKHHAESEVKRDNESDSETSRTEAPRRPADGSEISSSQATGANDNTTSNNEAAGEKLDVSDKDCKEHTVSIETASNNEMDITRTHSQDSEYTAPPSPWADLRNMLTAVKRVKKVGGNGKASSKADRNGKASSKTDTKEQKEGVSDAKNDATGKVDKHQNGKDAMRASSSDISFEENVVQFSSDEERDDEKNPYVMDGDGPDSGRDTPRLQELSESASIAMSDLRNMLSRMKKEETDAVAIQEQTEPDEESDYKGGVVMGYEADEEEMVEDDDSTSSSVFLRKQASKLILGDDSDELAHKFADHTYTAPTHCGICDGLLVGLWSQGLQCELCGLDVHRGEGCAGHDDCHKEALLTPCSGIWKKEEKPQTTLREVIKKSPNFFQDVKEQMNKDIKSQVKSAVVATGVEGERSKKLRRFRDRMVPLVETLDSVEARGEFYSFLVLMSFHIMFVNVLALVGFVGFILALWPRHGLLTTVTLRSAFLHTCTVLCTVQAVLFFLALILRRISTGCKRKSNIFDQFLRDVFKIDAKQDLGVSVQGATIRARNWSGRIVLSTTVTCCATVIMWHIVESPVQEIASA